MSQDKIIEKVRRHVDSLYAQRKYDELMDFSEAIQDVLLEKAYMVVYGKRI